MRGELTYVALRGQELVGAILAKKHIFGAQYEKETLQK